MTWVVIWDSNRFTLCFSDNMVFMGFQLPEGRKPGRWIFCSPSMNLMIKSLWFVNFKAPKLQLERPGSSCTKQEKQNHGNLQPVWRNEKKSSLWHYDDHGQFHRIAVSCIWMRLNMMSIQWKACIYLGILLWCKHKYSMICGTQTQTVNLTRGLDPCWVTSSEGLSW